MNKNKTKKLVKAMLAIVLLTVMAVNLYKPFISAKGVVDTAPMENKASESLTPTQALVENTEKGNATLPETEASQPESEVAKEASVTDVETTKAPIEETTSAPQTTKLHTEKTTSAPQTTKLHTEKTTSMPQTTKAHTEEPKSTTQPTTLVAKEVQSASLTAMEQQAFDMLNELRKANGVKPLKFENCCREAARKRATESVEYWSHTRPDGTSFSSVFDEFNLTVKYSTLGENLVKNAKTLDAAMNALENSEGHRENMLRPEFDAVAIGICKMEDGKFAMCQLFIKYA